jgi:hypothetical protein
MKKAKVSKGIIHHVWPNTKPDGRVVELPPQYCGGTCKVTGKEKSIPDCIIDVEDDVQQGWVWNETLQRYAPRIKRPLEKPRSVLVEVIAEKLGVNYDDLFAEIKQRKIDFVAERKKRADAVVAEVNSQLADKVAAGETITNESTFQIYNEVRSGLIEAKKESDDPGTGDVNL